MSVFNPQGTTQPSNEVFLLQRDIEDLRSRISNLESSASRQPIATSGMMSASFMSRAFSVWGHYFVASLIIGLVLLVLAALFGGCAGLLLGGY